MDGVKLAFWLVKTSFRLKYRRTTDATNQEKQYSEQTDFVCVRVYSENTRTYRFIPLSDVIRVLLGNTRTDMWNLFVKLQSK